MTNLTRRGFMVGASAVAGGCSGFFGARLIEYLGAPPETAWKTLTATEVETLEAIAEQLIPSDDAPGAREAKVVRYIDWQLAPEAPYEKSRKLYSTCLAAVDVLAAKIENGKTFAGLSNAQQFDLLKKIEGGQISKKDFANIEPRDFFRIVLSHVKQGFYGNPKHGGNDKYVSYRMLNVAGPDCKGRNVPS